MIGNHQFQRKIYDQYSLRCYPIRAITILNTFSITLNLILKKKNL